MHVRVAPAAGGRRLTRSRSDRSVQLLSWIVALAVSAGACGRFDPASSVRVEWTLTPTPPVVGHAVLRVHCLGEDGSRVTGASLRIEGHMSHPGMAPVVAEAVEREPGVYEAALEFTMPGDWILLVSGTLPNGAAVRHRMDVANVRPSE